MGTAGDCVGIFDGGVEGEFDGAIVFTVGLFEGALLGGVDGLNVGAFVGVNEGEGVGDSLYDFGKLNGQNPSHPNDRALVVLALRVTVVCTMPIWMQLVLSVHDKEQSPEPQ